MDETGRTYLLELSASEVVDRVRQLTRRLNLASVLRAELVDCGLKGSQIRAQTLAGRHLDSFLDRCPKLDHLAADGVQFVLVTLDCVLDLLTHEADHRR